MWHYCVAGIHIAIDVEKAPGAPRMINFEPFACEAGKPDLLYHFLPYPPETRPVPPEEEMTLVSEDSMNSLYMSGDAIYKCVAMQVGDPRRMWFEQKIGRWDEANVYIPDNWLDYTGLGNALSVEKTILPFGGLILHCSLIDWQGRGIMFSAPSQTGKSTQAGLWEKHRGAKIINGDRGLIRVTDDGIYAYGSPWAGSSSLYINERVPLRAIVMLRQAKENTIRGLDQSEAIGLFVQQSSLPMWQPELFEMGIATLEKIITTVPMYELSCLPDVGAVECLEKCLK